MHVVTAHGVVVVTAHALQRFRLRVRRGATCAEIADAVRGAELSLTIPGWLHTVGAPTDAWLVGDGWTLPLRLPSEVDSNRDEIDYVATTCLIRRRLPKDVVRWRREQAAEDAWAA